MTVEELFPKELFPLRARASAGLPDYGIKIEYTVYYDAPPLVLSDDKRNFGLYAVVRGAYGAKIFGLVGGERKSVEGESEEFVYIEERGALVAQNAAEPESVADRLFQMLREAHIEIESKGQFGDIMERFLNETKWESC